MRIDIAPRYKMCFSAAVLRCVSVYNICSKYDKIYVNCYANTLHNRLVAVSMDEAWVGL